MIKMVVLDMAGTTVNEQNVVYKTLQKAINQQGYDLSLEQVLAQGAGKEKLKAIKDILAVYTGRREDDFAQGIYKNFISQLGEAYDVLEVAPIEGAEQLFKALKEKNILIVLNTGYDAQTAKSLLKKLHWQEGKEIDGLITASDVANNRPMPDMILLAMKKFGISSAREVAKVGDSTIDIEEGRNAGCAMSIGITTGAHTREQLESAKPDYIINSLLELLPILRQAK
jgi:phosphonatase-like hydrolase